MTIRHLRTFVIVFQKESITKASEILHVSQPSVSLAIQELENYYHIRLFDRIGKRLSITEQGKWLYDYALHIVSMFDEMETEVKTWNNKGTLRIGSSITIGNFILPQLIEEFQKRYREVEIKVSVCNTKTIEQYILNNQVDLALIEGKTEYEQIQMEHLMEDPLCLICAANSELVKQEKISLIDLERYPMILRERGSAVREMIEESLGYHQIHHRVIWESVSTQAIIRAVAKKLGISILPYLLVRDELQGDWSSSCKWKNFICLGNFRLRIIRKSISRLQRKDLWNCVKKKYQWYSVRRKGYEVFVSVDQTSIFTL